MTSRGGFLIAVTIAFGIAACMIARGFFIPRMVVFKENVKWSEKNDVFSVAFQLGGWVQARVVRTGLNEWSPRGAFRIYNKAGKVKREGELRGGIRQGLWKQGVWGESNLHVQIYQNDEIIDEYFYSLSRR